MQDDEHQLTESIEDLPRDQGSMTRQARPDPSILSLAVKVFYDQWVMVALVAFLTSFILLVLDLGFGVDVMANDSKAAGRGGRNEDSTWASISFTIITFLITAVTYTVRFIRLRGVHVNGLDVPCQIIDRSKHVYNGLIDVTVRYDYAGRSYTPRVSIRVEQLGFLNTIRINRKKPRQYWLDW